MVSPDKYAKRASSVVPIQHLPSQKARPMWYHAHPTHAACTTAYTQKDAEYGCPIVMRSAAAKAIPKNAFLCRRLVIPQRSVTKSVV